MSDTGRLHVGDCVEVLRTLPARSVHCCVTSPPYWGLRDYGMEQQVGLEESPEAYVDTLVRVFGEVRRVLRPDGVLWLNLGDSYAQERGHGCWEGKGRNKGDENQQRTTKRWAPVGAEDIGLRAGSLMGLPWRVALALQADGWVLRSDTVWAKRNMLPESVAGWRWERCRVKKGGKRSLASKSAQGGGHRDKRHGNLEDQPAAEWEECPGCARCAPNGGLVLRRGSWRPTRSHEYVFQLAKSPNYFGDGEDVREPNQPDTPHRVVRGHHRPGHKWSDGPGDQTIANDLSQAHNPAGRNLRDVWFLPSQPSRLRHFAMMPPLLVDKCLRSSCPTHVCAACGTPHARVLQREARTLLGSRSMRDLPRVGAGRGHRGGQVPGSNTRGFPAYQDTSQGFRATCGCGADMIPGIVLDPFLGAGTVAGVAEYLGLRWEGIELNPEYALLLPDRVAEVRAYYERRAGRKQSPTPSAPDVEQLGLFGSP